MPVDAYGVGSALIRGSNDFTADVVFVDGRPCAKVGREARPNAAPQAGPRDQRYEAHALVGGALDAALAAAQAHQPLVAVVDRPDQPAAGRELRPPARAAPGPWPPRR